MILGGIALVAGLAVQFWAPERDALQAALIRGGIIAAAIGFALPRPGEKFHWGGVLPLVLTIGLFAPIAKRILPVAIPIAILFLILMTIFRPKPKQPPLR